MSPLSSGPDPRGVAALCTVFLLLAVFQAERDSERFALYAKKAALDERAAELKAQLKVSAGTPACSMPQHLTLSACSHRFYDPCLSHNSTG